VEDLDEAAAAVRSTGMRPSFWQMLYTTASMVGALNSVIFGIAFCLAVRGADQLPLTWAAGLAVVVALATLLAHTVYERRQFARGVV
jgi:hypothetical protein